MKKTKLPSLVAILILTLITAVMWVSLDIYRSFTSKPSPVVPPEISNPLIPTLDADTINQIESRLYLDDSQIPESVATGPVPLAGAKPANTPLPIGTPVPEATPATVSGTPTP